MRKGKNRSVPLGEREKKLGIQKPLHDVVVERAVLGSMLISGAAIYEVLRRGITVDHFYCLAHQGVFTAILALTDSLRPVDLVTLWDELNESGRADDAGGMGGVQALFDVIPTAANIAHYADALVRLYGRRQREADAAEGLRKLLDGEEDEAGQLFARAAEGVVPSAVLVPRSVQMRELREALKRQASGERSGVTTGFKGLDDITGGFVRGRSYIVAGRTSEGKSAVALQMALAAAQDGTPVHVFSEEMPRLDVNTRLLTLVSGVPLSGEGAMARLSEYDRERVQAALDKLDKIPIHIDDRVDELPRMVAEARRLKGKVGLFVIDHARLVPVPDAEGEYEAVTKVSGWAKRIALECEAAVILVAQINREGAKSGAPKLHHLQGSGALEQDADAAMLLTREAYGDPRSDSLKATLSVGKNRNGAGTVVRLNWRSSLMRFEEVL